MTSDTTSYTCAHCGARYPGRAPIVSYTAGTRRDGTVDVHIADAVNEFCTTEHLLAWEIARRKAEKIANTTEPN